MSNTVSPVFRLFQTELDGRHDKHERLVKLSRDITVASKRIIFLLHRVSRCMKTILVRLWLEHGNPCASVYLNAHGKFRV